ncbi:helix-turn-helix domain-containing protein [Paraburkholderia caballeronis]|uniref:Transcriptional regulator, Crp/Fnr family n=1 Tax=Paraburkholderia caballeronis TaxID=416943 RepID=A0A1H7P0I7_9BURK|nr:Crp/Fnr family transcriptional regulator [Paraburkholderia caballeronis]PXX01044.1 Crp/Fnr family transcriptional regulator [Paraburkholderia caballeronis]RAJ99603.1 Crp/Fnr family transcriptional regulator [Paraburkholderia caballeronis]TDV11418.1 Crp/Fnr family transcriptional regulator [Paraburkholderia caballeronis]TDV14608.1 Crp/Fnr family transcriptional regulator [Paraburkholderia caballeronis]
MLTPTVVTHTTVRRTNRAPVASPRSAARCSSCAMRHLCMPQGLAHDDLPKLEALICTARSVRRGEALYRVGDPFDNLYAVRSGSLKTVMAHRDGREQVTGLRLAGEPLGLDGISTNVHTCTAVALEDSSVCIVPYSALKHMCRETGAMQDRLHRLMGEQLIRETSQMMVLGSLSADERVAAFLLDVSERNGQRGYSHAEFNLRMTREDMGSYLGMTLETVSRTLSRFQKRGLIDAQGKLIRIVDHDGLRHL